MIKVGQVYNSDEGIFTISKLWVNISEDEDMAYVIYNDGCSDCWSHRFISKYSKLLAEYPTWQEAVNSKEFNNER